VSAARARELGALRVVEPPEALPQAAQRLDAESPPGEHELAIDVELLNLDSTSHAQLRDAAGGDADGMAASIADIVRHRGKLHNPVTGSGGILVGRVAHVGAQFPGDGVHLGERIVSLASLTLTPLRLESVGPVDPSTPRIPARGRAIVAAAMPWTRIPTDLPLELVLAALDVYGAASHTRALARAEAHVLVFGAGRAGLLAAAAATEAGATVSLVDVEPAALERARRAGVCASTVVGDATNAVAMQRELERAATPPGDLTVVVVNQPGCEIAAVLSTGDGGVILFFSMATSFTAAALGSEGVASTARMLIGSGYAPDRGTYALELLRARPRLRGAFEEVA
jgi:L-erythro-3,5-diaminohexanoate dehydrogenase